MNASMRNLWIACACVLCLSASDVSAQLPGKVSTVTFRNDLKVAVQVQGASFVGGMVRRGPALLILPGKTVTEFNVPAGANRNYSVYDANQFRPLVRDQMIPIPPGIDIPLTIREAGGRV